MNNPKMSSILEGLGQVNERQKAKAHKRMLKHNAEEIEKERKEQGAPKDAEYDAESGYFLKPGETDIYWSSKNKAYTLKWNGKDFVDESVLEAKERDNTDRVNEGTSGRWAQLNIKTGEYCGNGGRSWVMPGSSHIDTWETEEDAIKDGKENYKKGFKYGTHWKVVKLPVQESADLSVDEAKETNGVPNNQIRAMGKKMQIMAQVASNDVIMSFNDGKGDMMKTLTALRTVYAYSKELIEQFEDALRKVQGSL